MADPAHAPPPQDGEGPPAANGPPRWPAVVSRLLLILGLVFVIAVGWLALLGRDADGADGKWPVWFWALATALYEWIDGLDSDGVVVRMFKPREVVPDGAEPLTLANATFDLAVIQFLFLLAALAVAALRALLIAGSRYMGLTGATPRAFELWPPVTHYYVGFIFTLLSLAFGLGHLDLPELAAGDQANQVVLHLEAITSNAAAAMVSTVIGVLFFFCLDLFQTEALPRALGGGGPDGGPDGGEAGRGGGGAPGGGGRNRFVDALLAPFRWVGCVLWWGARALGAAGGAIAEPFRRRSPFGVAQDPGGPSDSPGSGPGPSAPDGPEGPSSGGAPPRPGAPSAGARPLRRDAGSMRTLGPDPDALVWGDLGSSGPR